MATSEMFVAGPHGRRTSRPAGTVVGMVLMSLVLALGVEHVVMAAPRDGGSQGRLQVQGEGGRDAIDVAGAYPGMPAQVSSFEVRNMGAVPVTFLVTAGDLVTSGPRSLDDVLRITVRDDAGVVYQGRLSGLRIAHTGSLAAGAAARFTTQVTWPSTASDDAYQGAGLRFSVVATPSAG